MKKTLLILSILLTILGVKPNAQITIENNQVAPEFANFKGTLLILENRDFKDDILNNMTKKRFEKFYKGQYEYITLDELKGKRYADKTKYRFVVQLRNNRTMSGQHNATASDATKFVMTDRISGTEYNTKYYSNWVTIMKQYPKALEKIRAK